MTARSMWKGAITFGLVTVPVKLYASVDSDAGLKFAMLHKDCYQRVKMPITCPAHGPIDRDTQTVKGFEFTKDQFVVLTDEELDGLKVPSEKAIAITAFIKATEPVGQVKATYYVAPDGVGGKAFELLRLSMAEGGVRAVGKVTLRQRESMCVIEPAADGLRVMTLYWPDEVRSSEGLVPPLKVVPSEAELSMGRQLIEHLTVEFDPTQYTDQYRNAVLELVERKTNNLVEAPAPEPVVQQPAATDLMAVLQASLDASKKVHEPAPEAKAKGKGKAKVKATA